MRPTTTHTSGPWRRELSTFPMITGPTPGFATSGGIGPATSMTRGAGTSGTSSPFLVGVAAGNPTRKASAWRAHQMYMAHFTLTDVGGERFTLSSRRAGARWAGWGHRRAVPCLGQGWSATSAPDILRRCACWPSATASPSTSCCGRANRSRSRGTGA